MSAQPMPSTQRAAGWAEAHVQMMPAARSRIWYLPASLTLLLPCYWQPRIQAGDLSSHIYNAWLASQIENGRTDGLTIVSQTTNVLFDLILGRFFQWFGADWAQRLAVSLSVLIFVWGAFAFATAVSGRRAWHVLPSIAMLAYGWVFHMGFFNFYLALGLCFWGVAALWEWRPQRVAIAAVLFAAAYTAHALPVVWALSLIAYLKLAERFPAQARGRLLGAAVVVLVAAHFVLNRIFISTWWPNQLSLATGVDQIWVFDGKYYFVKIALLLVWGSLFPQLLSFRNRRAVMANIPLHWCVLSAAGVFLIPSKMLFPGFQHALVYVAERMSLGVGVCVCVLLSTTHPRKLQRYALQGVAVVFFVLLFHDERVLIDFEDRLDQVVAQLPAGQRVVSPIVDYELRASAVTHMVDRACIGHCYSYGNYEPSTGQFRIRVAKPNSFVVARHDDSWKMENGDYRVKASDPPLVALGVSEAGQVTVRSLEAGDVNRSSQWLVLRNQPATR